MADTVAPSRSSIATERPTIAVVVPSLDYYWPGVLGGMKDRAEQLGMRVLMREGSYRLQDERPLLEEVVRGGEVTGLIVAPNPTAQHARDVIDWITTSGVPTVLVERDADGPDRMPLESVVTDHGLGAVLAARHLRDLGHRRVGLVLARDSPTSRRIAAGWRRACRELGLSPSEHLERVFPDRDSPDFSEAVGAMLDAAVGSGVTGLLVHSDPEAMAVVDLARARGIDVPGSMSVVAYDDEIARLYSPALTAVSPPRAAVGATSIDLLVARLRDPSRAASRVVLSPTLHVRESTRAPRA